MPTDMKSVWFCHKPPQALQAGWQLFISASCWLAALKIYFKPPFHKGATLERIEIETSFLTVCVFNEFYELFYLTPFPIQKIRRGHENNRSYFLVSSSESEGSEEWVPNGLQLPGPLQGQGGG